MAILYCAMIESQRNTSRRVFMVRIIVKQNPTSERQPGRWGLKSDCRNANNILMSLIITNRMRLLLIEDLTINGQEERADCVTRNGYNTFIVFDI